MRKLSVSKGPGSSSRAVIIPSSISSHHNLFSSLACIMTRHFPSDLSSNMHLLGTSWPGISTTVKAQHLVVVENSWDLLD